MSEHRILFLDDRWIKDRRGLSRFYPEAVKHSANPLIHPTEPWEEKRVYLFGSVLPQRAGFRMWYQTCSNGLEGPDKAVVCVADSDNLVDWEKPSLEAESFGSRKDTNIVLKCSSPKPLYSPSVILDDKDPDSDRRYKMLFWDSAVPRGPRGGCAAFSPDGIHWRRHGSEPLFQNPNDVLIAIPNQENGFVCYQTLLRQDASQDYPRDNLRGLRRYIGRRTSLEFTRWTDPEEVLSPDDLDPPDMQFYGMGVGRFGGMWIGLLWTYRAASQTSDVQLAWSHDGRNWKRPERRSPLISLGPPGSFDSHLVFTASGPIVHGGKIYIFYGGFNGPHDDYQREGAIGLATLRADGWCRLDADEDGELTTVPLPCSCREPVLNIDASDGECVAELVGKEGYPVPGYTFAECIPIAGGNQSAIPIRWRTGPPPDMPAGSWSLRLMLRRALLYSIGANDANSRG